MRIEGSLGQLIRSWAFRAGRETVTWSATHHLWAASANREGKALCQEDVRDLQMSASRACRGPVPCADSCRWQTTDKGLNIIARAAHPRLTNQRVQRRGARADTGRDDPEDRSEVFRSRFLRESGPRSRLEFLAQHVARAHWWIACGMQRALARSSYTHLYLATKSVGGACASWSPAGTRARRAGSAPPP